MNIAITEIPAAERTQRSFVATGEPVIALVDQSRLRRECLKLALAQHSHRWRLMDVNSCDEVVKLSQSGQRLDLVLIGAPSAEHIDFGEFEALRRALPETPVVVVADTDNAHRARLLLKAGARGFLPTSLSLKVLTGALDLVLAGGVYVPSSLIEPAAAAKSAWSTNPRSQREPWSELTRRQRDVLALIAQGQSNKLIANALTMSESTVKAHVKQIIKRLKVANRTQAALLATQSGAFPPPVIPPRGSSRAAMPPTAAGTA